MNALIRHRSGRVVVLTPKFPKTVGTEPLRNYEKQTLVRVERLIQAAFANDQDMSDAEMSRRQGELFEFVVKILHERRYNRIRSKVQKMVKTILENPRAKSLSTLAGLQKMA